MTTESKIYWGVGALSVLLFLGTLLVPGNPNRKDDFPWHIEHPTAESVRIFGLTLGEASASEAEQRFKEEAKLSLFKAPDGKMIVEAFFEQVNLAGLRSKVVLIIDAPEDELKGMYDRGLRMNSTGSEKKITLTPDDVTRLRIFPASSLTYMPGVRIEEQLFLERFGKPAQIIKETKSGAIHWLYPRDGLDITLGGDEKPVLQYVLPKEFDRLVKPLLTNGTVVTQ
jgi:hypothetical protein